MTIVIFILPIIAVTKKKKNMKTRFILIAIFVAWILIGNLILDVSSVYVNFGNGLIAVGVAGASITVLSFIFSDQINKK